MFLNSWSRKGLNEKQTSLKTEFIGGTTTFATMAYIVLVHPNMMAEAGMDRDALISVTCIISFVATLLVAFRANVPFAMAPGMGLNAFFTYTLVIDQGMPWQTALGVVFLSGILFLIMTWFGGRERIAMAIPEFIRHSVGAGIGLFIAFIGFQKMGLVTSNPQTLVQLGSLDMAAYISLFGLGIMVILELKKVKASILWGISAATLLGILGHLVPVPDAIVSPPASIEAHFFKLNILDALQWSLVSVIFSFMFVDLFDSIGTIVACSDEAGLIQKDKKIRSFGKVLEADAIATVFGALLGTSTTTTYIESASGISSGARTGLSSVFTALWFLVALFFSPLVKAIPDFAIGPALVLVGIFMFKSVVRISWKDINENIPAFLTMVLMPFTFNISLGLAMGFVSYIAISIFNGNSHKISWILWIIGVLSIFHLIFISF